jgi:hypothetical protein
MKTKCSACGAPRGRACLSDPPRWMACRERMNGDREEANEATRAVQLWLVSSPPERRSPPATKPAAQKKARPWKPDPCVCGCGGERRRNVRGGDRKALYATLECARAARLGGSTRGLNLKPYGLTLDQYNARLASQGERCAICRIEDPGRRGWEVDHDHETGEIRGILCASCNAALGFLDDDPAAFRRAALYLEAARQQSPITGAGRKRPLSMRNH